jgi:hypothetical protein
MARNHDSQTNEGSVVKRAARSVMRLFGRGRNHATAEAGSAGTTGIRRDAAATSDQARPVRRETDIPLDRLDNAYTPSVTSSKAGFRSDGADHQRDQEFALGVADDRWNDEDHYTNKSGDPRIGTRGRTYEPGEERAEPTR